MFISETHLPQVLPPDRYTSQEQYECEIEHLFKPGWHFIGCLDDIPNDGDYFTYDLFGHPIIVWNKDGEIHAFLNVCAHRFSTLRDDPCGNLCSLHCQYHGWEYDTSGETRKIPDAPSFKPMEKGSLGLKKYRIEFLGQAIYLTLAKEGPTLEEVLGPGYETGRRLFSTDRRLLLTTSYEVNANWKIKIENTLESYHIELIHPETFAIRPDAQICEHQIEPGFTTFRTSQPPPKKRDSRLNAMAHKIAGVPFSEEYIHHLYYPSIMMVETGLIGIAESTFPLSPSKSRVLLKFFAYTGPKEKLSARLLYRGIRFWGKRFFTKVVMEDAGILPSIQKGMESNDVPSEGLISIREERINHFQDFILRATSGDDPSAASDDTPPIHPIAS